jgi:hypothetical protein
MKKNLALTTLYWLCILVQVYFLVITLLLFAVPIFLHFFPDMFVTTTKIPESFSFFRVFLYSIKTTTLVNGQPVEYSALSTFFGLFLFYAQVIAINILALLSLQEFKKFIRSTKRLQTFFYQNVQSFKKISLYTLIIFLISSVNWLIIGDSKFFSFQLNLLPLIIGLFAYTFYEVFKEGNFLFEENLTTI